jgi:hypothetical protein
MWNIVTLSFKELRLAFEVKVGTEETFFCKNHKNAVSLS